MTDVDEQQPTPDEQADTEPGKQKKQKSVAATILSIPFTILQIVYTFLAFWDLANRPAEDVKGPKAAWIPVILINWVGPTSYFMFGIRR